MKTSSLLLFIYLLVCQKLLFAQSDSTNLLPPVVKSSPTPNNIIFTAIDSMPQYPGGLNRFSKDIVKNLKYPELAQLLGINGRVILTFVIGTDGKITDVTPINCLGAGCESEAISALYTTKNWKPAVQNHKRVKSMFTIPIAFNIPPGKVFMRLLRRSKYGFVFDINNKLYAIDEAEKLLGKAFKSEQIENSSLYNPADMYPELSGKEVYLLKIKTS